ncbi:MAG: glycosyltransferase [Bacteroidota bacterium]
MNVFVIPSWYPSTSNPIYGIFVKEQIKAVSRSSTHVQYGISLWGQGEEPYLLYASQPFESLKKLLTSRRLQEDDRQGNIKHYRNPRFIWTRKLLNGNFKSIVQSNFQNFERFLSDTKRVDLIHVHASYPGALIAYKLHKEYQIPYVISLHMSPFPFPELLDGQAIQGALKESLDHSHALIASSPSLHDRAEALELENLVTIPPFADTSLFCPAPTKDKSSKYRILCVGRLEKQKGFDILLDALRLIKHELSTKVEIVGDGGERALLDNLIAQNDLEEIVELHGLGTREQVKDKMQKCDLFILPSRHETFGIVLAEAMACGKPVVATQCGGPESIVTTDTGVLCPMENPEALAEAIKQALSKPWDAKKIRAHVEQNFSPSIFTQRMLALYQDVINKD